MAIPTITSITPAVGHAGGGTVLRIVGTGFQLPAAPPPAGAGPVPEAPPTVRVFLGGTEARRVRVASATVLYVTTERHDPGTVGVEVRNVGPFGETLGAETVTALAGYEYARPVFTTAPDLTRVVRALQAELVRQVFPEVVLTAHVDWSDDPVSVLRTVAKAPVPCVFLVGPTLRPNRVYATSVRPTATIAEDVVREHRAPHTDDVVFTLGALADKLSTLLALVAALRDFRLRNPWLYVPREEGGTELVRYDLSWEGDIVTDSSPNESNVRSASGTISVDGVDTLTAPGFESDQAITAHPTLVDDPVLESESV